MPRYRVVGPHPYEGNPPGSTFRASLSKDAEKRAIDRGAIEKASKVSEDADHR